MNKFNIKQTEQATFMPDVIADILNLFSIKYVNLKRSIILNTLLVKVAQMLTSKRIMIDEVGRKCIPNWYSMIFASSGFGKDRIVKDFNELIFFDFREWFQEKSQTMHDLKVLEINTKAKEKYPTEKQSKQKENFVQNELDKIRNVIIEMQDGTQEGFFSDAKTFQEYNFGSLFLTISEFGKYIQAATTDKEQFINCMYNAYDGKITSKCIKGGNREADVENLPVNILLYSDYNIIVKEVKHLMRSLLQTGLNRRSVISFQANTILLDDILSYEEEDYFNHKAKELGKKVFAIFEQCSPNSSYKLLPESKERLNLYSKKLILLFNDCDNEFLKAEIKSRDFKALKLSCLYACINHPNILNITISDIEQAINTIEFLSKDLESLINFRPQVNDIYDTVFNFFKKHLNEEFSTTDLKYKYFKQFGISRNNFMKNFQEIISTVKGIAVNNSYILKTEVINNNSGIKYCLQKIEIDKNIDSLETLLNASS